MELNVLSKKVCASYPDVSERDMANIIREVFAAMKAELQAAPDGKVKFMPLGTVLVSTREVDNPQSGEHTSRKRYLLNLKEGGGKGDA